MGLVSRFMSHCDRDTGRDGAARSALADTEVPVKSRSETKKHGRRCHSRLLREPAQAWRAYPASASSVRIIRLGLRLTVS